MKVLLHISFVGTHYCGYQVQPGKTTVQGTLCEAAKALFGFPCDVTGCSRTDSGVHASCFCATVEGKGENTILESFPVEKIPRALNSCLPDDISVTDAKRVPASFHARYGVAEKTYEYRFLFRPLRDPFLSPTVWHIPQYLSPQVCIAMQKAAEAMIGKHDFSAFMATGSKIRDCERTVFRADVEWNEASGLCVFRVSADGFLYNMVRIMAGTLLDVAQNRLKAEDIPTIIASGDRSRAGKTAPPQGLCLTDVRYGDNAYADMHIDS